MLTSYTMDIDDLIKNAISFNWDKGNLDKNWIKHKIKNNEIEEIFFNEPLLIFEDMIHSQKERRFYALGKTRVEKKLFVSFTMREGKIRPISARSINIKERRIYEKV